MKNDIKQRLNGLKQEFKSGEQMMAELDAKRTDLQQTMLRISGAIQVLEELLALESPMGANGQAIVGETAVSSEAGQDSHQE